MKKDLTKSDYEVAMQIYSEVYPHTENSIFKGYCQDIIKELSKPEPKRYKCIKPVFNWLVGEILDERTVSIIPTEYFEEVKAPEPYTMTELVNDIQESIEGSYSLAYLLSVLNKMLTKAKASL